MPTMSHTDRHCYHAATTKELLLLASRVVDRTITLEIEKATKNYHLLHLRRASLRSLHHDHIAAVF